MSDHKIRDGFRVRGPNAADYRIHDWYFPTLDAAKTFAEHIAADVDAEYEIFQYIGSVRQEVVPPRPLEFIGFEPSEPDTKDSTTRIEPRDGISEDAGEIHEQCGRPWADHPPNPHSWICPTTDEIEPEADISEVKI